jgi:hypothetical protein
MGHDFVLVKDGDAGLPISIIDVWELHRYTDVFCRYRLSFFCVGTCQLEKCQRLSFSFSALTMSSMSWRVSLAQETWWA